MFRDCVKNILATLKDGEARNTLFDGMARSRPRDLSSRLHKTVEQGMVAEYYRASELDALLLTSHTMMSQEEVRRDISCYLPDVKHVWIVLQYASIGKTTLQGAEVSVRSDMEQNPVMALPFYRHMSTVEILSDLISRRGYAFNSHSVFNFIRCFLHHHREPGLALFIGLCLCAFGHELCVDWTVIMRSLGQDNYKPSQEERPKKKSKTISYLTPYLNSK